jgi:hypothetical protein
MQAYGHAIHHETVSYQRLKEFIVKAFIGFFEYVGCRVQAQLILRIDKRSICSTVLNFPHIGLSFADISIMAL